MLAVRGRSVGLGMMDNRRWCDKCGVIGWLPG